MKHWLVLVMLALAACSTGAPQTSGGAAAEVAIDSGRLAGARSGGVMSFKGIPFAAPPLSELRWRAPQSVAHWSGVRPATAYGHDCMQELSANDDAPLGTLPAEDCLYLNVWRPDAAATKKLPVMVWIYGGGLVNGGSSPPTYSGAMLAKQGIVVVSFNYRLGRFGFFAHPALTKANADGGLLGNYGFMDEVAALKWVKRNIEAFGGDPAQVTIVGESAGGASVHMLATSPMAAGLFQRSVVMSGGGRRSVRGEATVASAEKVGLRFAEAEGIAADDPAALAKLRALSAETVTDGHSRQADQRSSMIDGKLVVEDAQTAYEHDRFAHAPMMIGATSNDLGRHMGAATKEALFARFGANADKARTLFDPEGTALLADLDRRVGLLGGMLEAAHYIAGL